MIKKTTLKNGLRIITIPQKNTKAVTFLVLVGTGSKYETKEVNGISHFLEHMFFKGTEKRKTTKDISETLDRIGGEYNAFTSKEITGYWAKVDSKHQDVALDWISDMFLNSKLEAKEIEKEKGVIIEEMNMYLDTPTAYIGDLWEELLYGNQPAGWKVIGEKQNIQQMTREKIVSYFKNHYSSLNTIICVAGNIGKIENKIKECFKNINEAKIDDKEKVKEIQKGPKNLIFYKETDQTHLCLGVRSYSVSDRRRYAVSLLATMLGGNMSSRLFLSVREKRGLAYYIRTVAETSTDTGFLMTQAGIDHRNIKDVIELITKEYRFFKDNLVSKEELQKAKDYIKGNMALSLETSDSQAFFYAGQEMSESKTMTPEEISLKIDLVTANDIKKVAEDIFQNNKLNLAIIGPVKEDFTNLLNI